MMAPKGSLLVLLLVLVLVLSACGMAVAWPPWKEHMSVNIINDVGGDAISVHCKSGDNDLGQHTVTTHQTYGFGFYPNFSGTTQYWCGFQWGRRWQNFTVWQDVGPWNKEKRLCKHCVYMVRADSFWRSEGRGGPFTRVYNWK